MIMIEEGHDQAVRFILARGVDNHIKDNDGYDACHYARKSTIFRNWPEF